MDRPTGPVKQPCGATTVRFGQTFTCVMWLESHADHFGGSPGVRGLVKWPNTVQQRVGGG